MQVYPAGIERSLFTSTSTPYVAFVCDWLETRITVRQNVASPGSASKLPAGVDRSGKRAEYFLRQMTVPVVEREIVDVLGGVFGRGRVLDGR